MTKPMMDKLLCHWSKDQLKAEIRLLREENERLKQQEKVDALAISELHDSQDRLFARGQELQEENERLKELSARGWIYVQDYVQDFEKQIAKLRKEAELTILVNKG